MDPEASIELQRQLQEMAEALGRLNSTTNSTIQVMLKQLGVTTQSNEKTNAALQNNSNGLNENTRLQMAAAKALLEQQKATEHLKGSFNTLRTSSITLADTILSTERGFAKYNSSIRGFGDAVWEAGKAFGPLGIAVGGLAKGISVVVQLQAKQADDINKFGDSWKKTGAIGGMTSTKLLELAHKAGYASQDLERLRKPMETLGNSIVNIGGTAQSGQAAFMNMLNLSDDTKKQFSRLGYSFDEVNDMQAEYIRLQALSGKSFSDSAKDQERLKKNSLEYANNLIELSSLTGENVDTIKKKQEEAAKEYQELVLISAEQAKIRELKRRGSAADLAEAERLDKIHQARVLVKNESGSIFGEDLGKQVRDYIRSGGRVQEQNLLAYQLGGKELEKLRQLINSGANKEDIHTQEDMLKKAFIEEQGKRSITYGGAIQLMSEQEATETGSKLIGTTDSLQTLGATPGSGKTSAVLRAEVEAAIAKATKEEFDKLADATAQLENAERKMKIGFDDVLLSVNPFTGGLDGAKLAMIALTAAAVAATVALGKMAIQGSFKGGAGGGGPFGLGKAAGAAASEEAVAAEAAAAKSGGILSKLGKAGSALGKFGKFAGKLGAPLAIAGAGFEAYQGFTSADAERQAGKIDEAEANKRKGGALGGAAGGLGGALALGEAGAALGTLVAPGVGTVVGGLIGGGIGYFGGDYLGKNVGRAAAGAIDPHTAQTQATEQTKKQATTLATANKELDTKIKSDKILQNEQNIREVRSKMVFDSLMKNLSDFSQMLSFVTDDFDKFKKALKDIVDTIGTKSAAIGGGTGAATLSGLLAMQKQAESGGGRFLRPLKNGKPITGTTIGGAYGMSDDARKAAYAKLTEAQKAKVDAFTGTKGKAPTVNQLVNKEGTGYTKEGGSEIDDMLAEASMTSTLTDLAVTLGRAPSYADARGAWWLGEAGYKNFIKELGSNPNMTMDNFARKYKYDSWLKSNAAFQWKKKDGSFKTLKEQMDTITAQAGGGSAGWSGDSASTPKAADGGIFSGPNSGYPMTMHGTELVLPVNNQSMQGRYGKVLDIKSVLDKLVNSKEGKTTDKIEAIQSVLNNTVKDNSTADLTNMYINTMDTLTKKLDTVIGVLESSHSTQNKLLSYTMN